MSDVSFILVYVDDVAKSEAFYASILGRPAIESSPTFAMLPAGPSLMLGLWKRDGVEPRATPAGGGEIAFTASSDAEVDARFAEWSGRGVKIAQPPTRLDFGYAFVGLDPDGQRLRVFAPAPNRRARSSAASSTTLPRPGLKPFEEGGREIALGEGGDDDNDRLARVFGPAADVDRRGDGGAGRDPHGDALDSRDQPGGVE
jgi:predicted enzyme related to lactoylglutathione lyase